MISIFPEILRHAEQSNIELLACLVRSYYGGDEAYSPRLNIDILIKTMGIRLVPMDMEELGVLLAKDESGRFGIMTLVSTNLSDRLERRFLLAHQLGHILCDFQPRIANTSLESSGFRELTSPLDRYLSKEPCNSPANELRADRFAGALLMPQGMLLKASDALKDSAAVAEFFAVSEELVARRLYLLSHPEGFRPTVTEQQVPIEKLNQQIGSNTYQHHVQDEKQSTKKQAVPKEGLQRLRQLAKMIDSTVDV